MTAPHFRPAPTVAAGAPPTQAAQSVNAASLDTRVNRVLRLPRPHKRIVLAYVLAAALWGIIVDTSTLPVLAPTGNSTVFQASTAALFASIGILFGPLAGGMSGLVRDSVLYLASAALDPAAVAHEGVAHWAMRATIDILEDVVLGLVPGLLAQRTRRLSLLVVISAATAWLSLPLLVASNALLSGPPADVWRALTTRRGDWDEPVDPGLVVYALLTGALVALVLARRTSQPRASYAIALLFSAPALLLILLGAHQ